MTSDSETSSDSSSISDRGILLKCEFPKHTESVTGAQEPPSQIMQTSLPPTQNIVSSAGSYTGQKTNAWLPNNRPITPTDSLTAGKSFLLCNEVMEHMID
jgi:hypothetical protein